MFSKIFYSYSKCTIIIATYAFIAAAVNVADYLEMNSFLECSIKESNKWMIGCFLLPNTIYMLVIN